MKKIIIVVLVLLLIVGFYWFKLKGNNNLVDTKQQSLHVSIHSDLFNLKLDSAMQYYYDMKDAFVNADTSVVKLSCSKMITAFDSIPLNELKVDTTGIYDAASMQLSDIKANAQSLLSQTDITEMRQDFRMVSENIYPFLKTIHYSGNIVYWQNCPMAFGEDKAASWLSNTAEIINPYLGKNHPVHKDKMLHCGEIKDSIK